MNTERGVVLLDRIHFWFVVAWFTELGVILVACVLGALSVFSDQALGLVAGVCAGLFFLSFFVGSIAQAIVARRAGIFLSLD